VANVDVILVHELSHEQLRTTKELLNIAIRHALGEEAVGATFILGSTGTTTGRGWAVPTKSTAKSARKGAKGRKKG
jgi:hypothetical protein